jgi:glycosyltransferase involved in cell wall biosynthesis
MASRRPVVFLTDIVTPYMVAVLGALARRVDLLVLFSAPAGSRGAGWAFPSDLGFRHRVLGGVTIRRPAGTATDLYPNPKALFALFAERPCAVISGGFSFPTLSAALYGRIFGAPWIIHSDGTSHSERNLSRAHLLARHVLVREAAACVANSEPAADRFIELGAPLERVFRAPHSTDIRRFHAVAQRRFAAPTDEGLATVLHVGRLTAGKGIDRLLQAVSMAGSQIPLRLVLVGSGPEEPRLRRLAEALDIAGAVDFRGFVDQPELAALYAEADVFAFPTLDDTFGIVVLEAAASGLPIVASPFCGATLDLLEDGHTGYVARPDDVEAWSTALACLVRDSSLRRRLGVAAYEATLNRTPEHAAAGYVKAVEASLPPHRRSRASWGRRRKTVGHESPRDGSV